MHQSEEEEASSDSDSSNVDAASISCVPKSPSRACAATISAVDCVNTVLDKIAPSRACAATDSAVDYVNTVLDRITSTPAILGTFDKVVTVGKEGKKRCHKHLIFRNLSEFAGSLHNRAIWKAVGSRHSSHRRSSSLFINDVHNKDSIIFSMVVQECRSEVRKLLCHDNNSEASIIDRNNHRQWSHFDKEFGVEFWKAMESLGVVHKGKEGEILARLEKMENQSLLIKKGVKEFKVSSL